LLLFKTHHSLAGVAMATHCTATAVASGMAMLLPLTLQHCAGACWSWWLGLVISMVKLPSLAVLLLGVAVNLTMSLALLLLGIAISCLVFLLLGLATVISQCRLICCTFSAVIAYADACCSGFHHHHYLLLCCSTGPASPLHGIVSPD